MRLLAQHLSSLVHCFLYAIPAGRYQSSPETLHLPQLHLPRSAMDLCMSIYAAAYCILHAHISTSVYLLAVASPYSSIEGVVHF